MDLMFERFPEKTNRYLYFKKPFDGKIADEQQLSGHSWYLRALVAYAQTFGNSKALEIAESTVENLFLPVKDSYKNYSIEWTRERRGQRPFLSCTRRLVAVYRRRLCIYAD